MDSSNTDNKTFIERAFGPGDEEKEACIHCHKVWYVIHHKDGVCYYCQQKGLLGRAEIEKNANIKAEIKFAIFLAIIALCIYVFLL